MSDLQQKYRETLEGTSTLTFLYSNSSKLAVMKNFREEVFGLMRSKPLEEIKASPIVHLKDFASSDQIKYLFKPLSLPMNPTALNQAKSQS
jgi:hypothetical protein